MPALRSIRNNFVVGIVVVTPIVVTGFVANLFFRFLTNNPVARILTDSILRVLPYELQDAGYKQTTVRILSALLMILALLLIGYTVRSYLGKKLYRLGDRILARIPIISRIYLYVRRISEAILTQRRTLFKEVVLIQYPRQGIYSLGFLTTEAPPNFRAMVPGARDTDRFVSIFVPTTPNPTSGMYILLPRDQVTKLPISVSEGIQLIVSAGAVYPGAGPTDGHPTLLDKLESWIGGDTPAAPPPPPKKA